MKYVDRIYGEMVIDDPLAIEIIRSRDFERLKNIDQAGYFDVYFPGTKNSRFEHSVGCYLLLKRYNASREEQISGLIHDVSHSAFSHTADYLFSEGSGAEHNYQDDIFTEFIQNTDIPKIIAKYGLDVAYILDEKNFPLQETELPDICADRIDYSLRGARVYARIAQKNIDHILAHLHAREGVWTFDAYEPAFLYARIFKELNDVYYSGKETAAMFLRTAAWMQYAVKNAYITKDDIFTNDDHVIKKVNQHLSHDQKLCELWKKMNDPKIVLSQNSEKSQKIIVKSRIIDPFFMKDGKRCRVSDLNPQWAEIVKRDLLPRVYYLHDQ
jgi:uncharacterized protein